MLSLYCVTEGSCELTDLRGAHGERLRPLPFDGVTAVVGESRDGAPAPSVAALRGHDELLRRLAARCRSVVPMRFGQHYVDEHELAQRLLPQCARMSKLLQHVAGCVQMAVRVHGGGPGLAAAVEGEEPARPGTRYLLARRGAAAAVLDPLRARTRAWVRDELLERSRDEPEAATLYQLIPSAHLDRWRAVVAAYPAPASTASAAHPSGSKSPKSNRSTKSSNRAT